MNAVRTMAPGECREVPTRNPKVVDLRRRLNAILTGTGDPFHRYDAFVAVLTDLVNEEAYDLEYQMWRTPCR